MASDIEVMSTNDNGTYVEDNPYEVSLFSSFYLEIFFWGNGLLTISEV